MNENIYDFETLIANLEALVESLQEMRLEQWLANHDCKCQHKCKVCKCAELKNNTNHKEIH